jgi:hypothetical protein
MRVICFPVNATHLLHLPFFDVTALMAGNAELLAVSQHANKLGLAD